MLLLYASLSGGVPGYDQLLPLCRHLLKLLDLLKCFSFAVLQRVILSVEQTFVG